MSTASPAPAKKRVKKRFLIPGLIVGILLTLLIVAIVRGTWGSSEPKTPASAADGIICHLYKPEGEPWKVRCAAILEHPIDKVWAVVTDYEHFSEIFPTLETATVERKPNGNVRLSGQAIALTGDYPYDITITHDENEKEKKASWQGGKDQVKLLKGGWVLTPVDEKQTLVVYNSHTQVAGYPDWAVVNLLLHRQPKVLRALKEHLEKAE